MFCGIATKRLLFFAAIGVVRSLSFEVERALFERVNVAHHQDRNKTENAPEDEAVLLDRVFVNSRPGIHENDLEVEKDEEHRHEIELHAEPRMAFALRHHTAFVSGIFGSCALSACSNQNTDQQCRAGKEYCYNNLQENRQIFAQHPEVPDEDKSGFARISLSYAGEMAILLGDCRGQSRRQALVFLAVLLDRAASDEVLQFLVGSQAEHFLATAGGVPGPKILVHDVEQLLKLEGRTPGQHCHQLLSHQVRDSTGKCVFLQNSHKARMIAEFL